MKREKNYDVYYIRDYVEPKDPKTEKQILKRNKFREAIKMWRSLSDEVKEKYNERAWLENARSGYHLFIREFFLLGNF